jgi:hypothetical protein
MISERFPRRLRCFSPVSRGRSRAEGRGGQDRERARAARCEVVAAASREKGRREECICKYVYGSGQSVLWVSG